ncbi:hypothetical protein [Spiroplasma floricola]|uniref:Uncharacterized protein n=1 Tax=Spiroplasma floricola 23-6 TaxID=1336749 RepID=A0A2K8SFA6_9MOLU|nr:hypothetical protein [Spiroplasma floricola]AUB32124.1 hypothetical protein SFLOR_v1c10780 [Spiroplasma floricola 23-6]
MVWGESNSRDFLDWADFCRNNTVREKSINTSINGANFANDKSSSQYNSVKATILNTIESYKSISVQQLYNVLPESIVANPTSKHVILQLYFEDNLKIQGQAKNNNDRESNFVLIFVKKMIPKQPAPLTDRQKGQSNIEDLIDNNWQATGRKLEFDKMERKDKSNLNISLKRVNPTPTNRVGEKPNIDVRETIKEKPIPTPIPKAIPKEEIPVKVNSNITYIEIPKPKPEIIKEEVVSPIKMNLEYRPTPKVKEVIIEDKVFYGLSAFDLYYIEAFLSDAAIKEEAYQKEIKITRDIVKVRGDIKYTEEKQYSSLGKNIAKFFGCLTIVGIPFVIAYSGNKIRKKATKTYKEQLKNRGYDSIKQDLKLANPKIIEF